MPLSSEMIGEGGERAQWYGDKGSLYMANGGLHGDIWQARPAETPVAKPLQYPDYIARPASGDTLADYPSVPRRC